MATIFVRHHVADYAAWKRTYDEFSWFQKQGGVREASVHRDPGDPNTIVVRHRFDDLAAARAFVSSDELKRAMQRADV